MSARALADAASDIVHLIEGRSSLRTDQGSGFAQESFAAEAFRRRLIASGHQEQFVDKLIELGRAEIASASRAVESPIERMLLPWLVFQDYGPDLISPAAVHVLDTPQKPPPHPVIIVPQFPFLRHRLDFAILIKRRDHAKLIAVECDGAEYHDARSDWGRDRWLEFWGIKTFRATGAEINREPERISARVARHVVHWASAVQEIEP